MGLEIEAPTPDKYKIVNNGTRVQLSTLQGGDCESFGFIVGSAVACKLGARWRDSWWSIWQCGSGTHIVMASMVMPYVFHHSKLGAYRI